MHTFAPGLFALLALDVVCVVEMLKPTVGGVEDAVCLVMRNRPMTASHAYYPSLGMARADRADGALTIAPAFLLCSYPGKLAPHHLMGTPQ